MVVGGAPWVGCSLSFRGAFVTERGLVSQDHTPCPPCDPDPGSETTKIEKILIETIDSMDRRRKKLITSKIFPSHLFIFLPM